jgi:DNA-binding transcriptional ArsR family regulator
MKRASLSDKTIELIAGRFRVLGEPQRLRILQALSSGDKSVGEIAGTLKTTQPNASKHLHALADAGLVARRREGNNAYYSITDPVIFRICDLVCSSAATEMRKRLAGLETVHHSGRRPR